MISVLYIDNDEIILAAGKRFLESDEDIRVSTARTFPEARQHLQTSTVDAIIADIHIPGIEGTGLLDILHENFPHLPLLIFSGSDPSLTFAQAIERGAEYYLVKDGDPRARFAELSHLLRRSVRLRETERKVGRVSRVYSVLTRVGQAAGRSGEQLDLLQEICTIAVQEGGYPLAWIGIEESGTRRIRSVVASGAVDEFFTVARISSEDTATGTGPTASALRKGTPVVCNDIRTLMQVEYWAEQAIRKGYLSAAAIPIRAGHMQAGVFTLYSRELNFFTESELRMLQGVADDVSHAMEARALDLSCRKTRLEQESAKDRLGGIMDFFYRAAFATDAGGNVILWNTAMERLTGIPAARVLGKGNFEHSFQLTGRRIPALLDLVLAADQELADHQYTDIRRSNGVITAKIRLSLPTGTEEIVEVTAAPLRDRHGQVCGAIETLAPVGEGTTGDGTYRRVFETADHGIFILRHDTRTIIDVNFGMVNLTGLSYEDLLGRTIEEAGLFREKPAAEVFFAELKKSGFAGYRLIPLVTSDGRILEVGFVGEVYTTAGEEFVQCHVRDLTARRQAEKARITARNNLQQFSSVTRHDILNQLMVVNGSLELASYGAKDPELLQHLNRALTAAKNIQRQITFSREYEKLGATKPVWHHLTEVIHQAFLEIQPEAVSIEEPLDPVEVLADPLLDKVFFYLLRFMKLQGDGMKRIVVAFRYSSGALRITLAGDGTGIPADGKKTLFERAAGNDKTPGLILAQKILEVTGLTVQENGEERSGIRFEIMVPEGKFRPAHPR